MPNNQKVESGLIQAAHNITEWTKERGMTTQELSECTKVPYLYLSCMETGMVSMDITLLHLDVISRFCGKKMIEIFS